MNSPNSFGSLFTVTTFGESHGEALGCIIDGCPPGLALAAADLQQFLDKRRPGQSFYTSQRQESDRVQILSGIFEGLTTGTPIALLIKNEDQRSSDYNGLKDLFRPGHADFTYYHKYGHRDYRGGGRASARETVARVAAGAVARLYLERVTGIKIRGFLQQLGPIVIDEEDMDEIDKNAFFCPNKHQISLLGDYLTDLREKGDSIGAAIKIVAYNVPPGLGDPVFAKIDATLAYAMMSINAVKGVEIGMGFAVVDQLGSAARDEITNQGFMSNNAGGTLGGITTGQDLELRLALKPTSSIVKSVRTVTTKGKETTLTVTGRHDPCVGLRAVPIAEAMMALVLINHYLKQKTIKNYA